MLLDELERDLRSGARINILFVGDSITSAEWVHPNWREIVEYVLKEELTGRVGDWKKPSWGIRCFNYGFDGSTTADILDRADDMLAVNPYLAIYLENTNELHYDYTPEQHVGNVKTLASRLLSKCRRVVVCNSIAGNNEAYNERLGRYSEAVRDADLGGGVTFVDTNSEYAKLDLGRMFTFRSEGNENLGLRKGDIDFVHPNQLGNAHIARIILDKAFGIGFDAEKYIDSAGRGDMFPEY